MLSCAPFLLVGFEQPILEGGSALFKKFNVWFIMAGTSVVLAGTVPAVEGRGGTCLALQRR